MICVFGIIKNEHLYLDEWIQYHLNIGFDRIYITEDFGSNSHKDITDKYGDKVVLNKFEDFENETKLKNAGIVRQRWLYNNYLNLYSGEKSDVEWGLFIDIDEFFRLDEGLNLREFCEKYKNYASVSLQWKCYGANGHINRPNMDTISAYNSQDNLFWHKAYQSTKCFVNFKKDPMGKFQNVHLFTKGVKTDFSKVEKHDTNTYIYKYAWIDHYMTKSWEDWILRLQRGNVIKNARNIQDFFDWNPDLRDKKDQLIKELNLEDSKEDWLKEITSSYIVISMTSYPERLKFVPIVWDSIIKQIEYRRNFKLYLTLSEEEFPNKEQSIPSDVLDYLKLNDIEIIWWEKDIKSHKKLIPFLVKISPLIKWNSILLIDDDNIKPNGWLNAFLEDHKKYNSDILFGACSHSMDVNGEFKLFPKLNGESGKHLNKSTSISFKTVKPSNGMGGILYPSFIFAEKSNNLNDFLNPDIFMELTPNSDELWQAWFCVMNNFKYRSLSKNFNYYDLNIPEAQIENKNLSSINNKDEYNNRQKLIMNRYPEYIECIKKNNSDLLTVCLSTKKYSIKKIIEILTLLSKQTLIPRVHIITSDDKFKNLRNDIKTFKNTINIEVFMGVNNCELYSCIMHHKNSIPIWIKNEEILKDKKIISRMFTRYMWKPNCLHGSWNYDRPVLVSGKDIDVRRDLRKSDYILFPIGLLDLGKDEINIYNSNKVSKYNFYNIIISQMKNHNIDLI